jgi:hypothetical protein
MTGPRIALLLSGVSSDLTASVSAVQLAGRTESRLFVLQSRKVEGESLEGLNFVTEFATLEGVKTNCHLLVEGTVAELADFLLAHSVTWLVVGVWPEESRPEREAWLGLLRERLREAPERFCPELQIIVAAPLAEGDLERIISQSRRLSRLVAGKKQEKGHDR